MKKLKVKLTYESVVCMTDNECEKVEGANIGEVKEQIKAILDESLLAEDGREESSEITDFNLEINEVEK